MMFAIFSLDFLFTFLGGTGGGGGGDLFFSALITKGKSSTDLLVCDSSELVSLFVSSKRCLISSFITTFESFKHLTQSVLVMVFTGTESISRTSSPSTREPHEHSTRDAGLFTAHDWMKSRRTNSADLVPPSNFKPKPSFSPGNL